MRGPQKFKKISHIGFDRLDFFSCSSLKLEREFVAAQSVWTLSEAKLFQIQKTFFFFVDPTRFLDLPPAYKGGFCSEGIEVFVISSNRRILIFSWAWIMIFFLFWGPQIMSKKSLISRGFLQRQLCKRQLFRQKFNCWFYIFTFSTRFFL